MSAPVLDSPLEAVARAHGAMLVERDGRRVVAHYGSVAGETAVCLRSVGLADRTLTRPPTDDYAALGLVGPRARAVLAAAALDRAPFPATVIAGRDGYEVLVPREDGPAAWAHLLHAGEPFGIACVGQDALDHLAVARR